MSPTILSRRYAPAASVQSSYLTLSGCQLLSQGGPGVRLARHRWRRKALYATRGGRGVRYTCTIVNAHHAASVQSVVLPHAFGLPAIVAGWAWCATSTVSAAAASTATTTMHSPTHRRQRQALRRQRCTARPLFKRPAWPRRALRTPMRTT
jgi:hypothetical protein